MKGFRFVVTLLYCTNVIFGQEFASKKYEEPTCSDVKPAPSIETGWITKIPAWYVPMASAYVFHSWAEKLTKKSSTPQAVQQLCLKFLFLAPKKPNTQYMVVAGGLKKAVGYRCLSKGPHHHECNGVPGTPGFKPGVEFTEVAVHTDNKQFVLMVQCIRNSLKAWYVMTPTTQDLSSDIKKEVLTYVIKLGFDKKFGALLSYAKCPKGKQH